MIPFKSGAWRLSYSESDQYQIKQKNNCNVADVYGTRDPRAAGLLLAASPDLYEALQLALITLKADFNTRIQQPDEARANSVIIEVIEKALNKAEGKST